MGDEEVPGKKMRNTSRKVRENKCRTVTPEVKQRKYLKSAVSCSSAAHGFSKMRLKVYHWVGQSEYHWGPRSEVVGWVSENGFKSKLGERN